VPRLLQNEHLEVYGEHQQLQEDPNFLSKAATGDESWVCDYDPENKQQYSQWRSPSSPRPEKARKAKSNIKSMLLSFIIGGNVHKEFFPTSESQQSSFAMF
jgi:hypothetical protein